MSRFTRILLLPLLTCLQTKGEGLTGTCSSEKGMVNISSQREVFRTIFPAGSSAPVNLGSSRASTARAGNRP
ncbi:MAG: hypothetical protein WAM39_05380 [Bryobacteraceae bacterium]